MSLQSELTAFFKDFAATMPASRLETIEETARMLGASGITGRALKEGDAVPDFALPAADGTTVSLASLLRAGPVVLTFNRGGWCPFCSLELRAYQKAFAEITRAGGSLLSVLPQTPERSREMSQRMGLTFPVLSDHDCRLADRFGVAFDLPENMQRLYLETGRDLADYNGAPGWRLPLPATYIIATDGRIALADVDVHIQRRLEPLDAIEAVRKLTRSCNAAA